MESDKQKTKNKQTNKKTIYKRLSIRNKKWAERKKGKAKEHIKNGKNQIPGSYTHKSTKSINGSYQVGK